MKEARVAVGATHELAALMSDSEAARASGEYAAGARLADQAVRLAADAGLFGEQARALRLYANQKIRMGEVEVAVQACEDSATLLRASLNKPELCETLLVKGFALLELGLHAEALECLREAADMAAALGDRIMLYWVQNRLGVAYNCMGDYELADQYLLNALDQSAYIDDEALFCVLANLSDNAMYLVPQLRDAGSHSAGQDKLALGLQQSFRALELAEQSGNPYRVSMASGSLGVLLGLSADFETGLAHIARSAQLAKEHSYRSLELAAVLYEALVTLWSGRTETAIPLFLKACEPTDSDLQIQLTALEQLSESYERIGQFREALLSHKRFRAMEVRLRSSVADTRARLLARHLELDNARFDATEARTESARQRARGAELESDVRRLKLREAQLEQDANRDALTGVGNRRYLSNVLPELFGRAVSSRRSLSAAVIDIDHFKQVNDSYGHDLGDKVLARVAQLIVGHSRSADVVGRLGGEEFLLVLVDAELRSAAQICERLRAEIETEPWHQLHLGLRVSVSIGVSTLTDEPDCEELVRRADRLLYVAKSAGRNRIQLAAS